MQQTGHDPRLLPPVSRQCTDCRTRYLCVTRPVIRLVSLIISLPPEAPNPSNRYGAPHRFTHRISFPMVTVRYASESPWLISMSWTVPVLVVCGTPDQATNPTRTRVKNTTARPYANLFLSEFIVSASLTPVVPYAGHDRMFATGSCRLHLLPRSQDAEKVRQPVLFIWSVRCFLFVWLHETNQMDQTDR